MSRLKKRVPVIIRKLEAAEDAMDELIQLTEGMTHGEGMYLLKKDIREFAEYLDQARWWRK